MHDIIVIGGGHGRLGVKHLVAACQATAHRAESALASLVPGQSPEHERHEHGGGEQGRQVRGVLPELSQGRCVDEDARYHKTYSRPAQVHAVARRCCELAGCRRGTCLACLATRQRYRPADDVPGPSDLVQQEATTPTVRNCLGMDWPRSWRSSAEMDRLRLSGTGVSQASDR